MDAEQDAAAPESTVIRGVTDLLDRWSSALDKWRDYRVDAEQSDSKLSIAARVDNDDCFSDLALLYTPTSGFQEERHTLDDELSSLVAATLTFASSEVGFCQLRNPLFGDDWMECRDVMNEMWLTHAYEWFHDRHKKTVCMHVNTHIKPTGTDADDNDGKCHRTDSSASASASSSSSASATTTQANEVFVTTSLGVLFAVVMSFIDTHVCSDVFLRDMELRQRVTTQKVAEQLVDELAGSWNHVPATLSDDLYDNRHAVIMNKVKVVLSKWLWELSQPIRRPVHYRRGYSAHASASASAHASNTDASYDPDARVIDMDPDFVGIGVRGLRPINEAVLTLWYMQSALQTVYLRHVPLAMHRTGDALDIPEVEDVLTDRVWSAWRQFLSKHIDVETTSAQNSRVRSLALWSRARVGARGLYAMRESQAEETVDAIVGVQQIHPGDGLQWVKESKPRIKDVFAVLDNPESHPLRGLASLVFLDRTFQSYFDVQFLSEFVLFEWDLHLRRAHLYHRRSGLAQRRPWIVFVLGRFWVQVVAQLDSDTPLLIACPNAETAILLWSYLIVYLHNGVLRDGADLCKSTELPFMAALRAEVTRIDNPQPIGAPAAK